MPVRFDTVESYEEKKVIVAMSGGVDSSVAAALLIERGFEVVGDQHEALGLLGLGREARQRGSCCSLEDVYDARRVCNVLSIPFYVMNMEEAFSREVVRVLRKELRLRRNPEPVRQV